MQSLDPKVREWLERAFDPDEDHDQVLSELENETPELRAMIQRFIALDARSHSGAVESVPTAMASPAPAALGVHRFAGYEILEELRPGGMSQVYRARHESDPARANVAIKVVNALSPEVLERFAKEVTILRKLQHPQIATLFDDGQLPDGRPFLVMEYIEGETIGAYAGDRTTDEIVALVRNLCDPLAYCHQRGIWHRDIKPSNVIVRPDGVPILIDFGIAKAESSLLHVTATMNRAMTALYAAPEQTAGDCTDATDTYSVGMLLYQLLSGRIAYNATTHREWTHAIRTASPIPIARALEEAGRAAISDQLVRVVDKAIRKEPERRYTTALDLAADLENYLMGKSVVAKRDDPIYLAKRAAVQHRALLLAAFVALTWAVFATGALLVVTRERDAADTARTESEQVVALLTDVFEGADPYSSDSDIISEPTARDLLDTGLKRLEHGQQPPPRVRVALLGTVATIYRNLGFASDAVRIYDDALATLRDVDTGRLPQLQEILCGRGEAFRLLDRPASARADLKRCQDVAVSVQSPLLAASYLSLGTLEREVVNLAAAERYLEHGLAAVEALEPPEPQLLGNLSAEMGVVLEQQGPKRYGEALEWHERGLFLRKEALPTDHPFVAESFNNIGVLLGKLGRFPEAVSSLENALSIFEQNFNEPHPLAAEALSNLGMTLKRAGQHDQAIKHFTRAVELQEALTGERHRRTITMLYNLGSAELDAGDPDRAVELLSTARNRVRADDPTLLGPILSKQGLAYLALGLEEEAIQSHRAALTHLEEGYGSTGLRYARALGRLADATASSAPVEARSLALASFRCLAATVGDEHEETVVASRRATEMGISDQEIGESNAPENCVI